MLILLPLPSLGETLQEGVSQVLDTLDFSTLDEALNTQDFFADSDSFRETLCKLALGQITLDFDQVLSHLAAYFLNALRNSLWRLTRLAAPGLIWSILCRLLGKRSETGQLICLMMVCVFLVSDLSDHTTLCLNTVEKMSGGMQGLFPLLLSVMAALGSTAGSALIQPVVVASAGAMVTMIRHVTLPLAVCSAVLTMLCHLGSSMKLSRLCRLSQQCAGWTLGIGFTVFIGVITIRGITAAAVDGVTLRTAKYALDNFVPIVGGLFADTVDTLVGSGMLVQGALGVTGLILICSWCLVPLCQTFAAALLYKLAAALLQPLADGDLGDCLHDFSQVLMLLFVIQLCAAAMFLLLIGQIVGVSGMTMMLR